MKTLRAMMAMAVGLLAGAAAQSGDDSRREFEARLTGDQEVPPVVTQTSGKAELVFNRSFTKAEYELTVRRGVRVTQAHIHCAPPGVNGPIVVWLAGLHAQGWDVNGDWIENATITDANVIPPTNPACPHPIANLRDLVEAIKAGNTYVNVHTQAHPSGEVRGQLRRSHDEHDD
jgi:hypothetical protein